MWGVWCRSAQCPRLGGPAGAALITCCAYTSVWWILTPPCGGRAVLSIKFVVICGNYRYLLLWKRTVWVWAPVHEFTSALFFSGRCFGWWSQLVFILSTAIWTSVTGLVLLLYKNVFFKFEYKWNWFSHFSVKSGLTTGALWWKELQSVLLSQYNIWSMTGVSTPVTCWTLPPY